MILHLLLCISVAWRSSVSAFYMPGVRPHDFQKGEIVPLKVNSMTSVHTQLPKDYYRLPFCQPEGGPSMASENLGEFLTGNKIQDSPYEIHMLEQKYCKILCQVTLDLKQAQTLRNHIFYGYHNNWIIDNLPSAVLMNNKPPHYAGGFPIGSTENASSKNVKRKKATDKNLANVKTYVYNHVNIFLKFHRPDPQRLNEYRVVGFGVEPVSVKHEFSQGFEWDGKTNDGYSKSLDTCFDDQILSQADVDTPQVVAKGETILYTYGVFWEESDIAWSSRWDVYLSEDHAIPAQVHWYAISNSVMVILLLSVLVIGILVRNLKRDIAGYNAVSTLTDEEREDLTEESGWKVIHADVFRPPSFAPMLYSVFVGSGIQLALTTGICIILSAVGFVNPARRGSLMNSTLAFYILFGSLAGFVSSVLYKAFRGRSWQLCTILTAIFFPGLCFIVFLFFNIILFFFKSTASVPVIDVILVAALWCCISIPMVFVGAYFGYKMETLSFPTVTSTIARAIPSPSLMTKPLTQVIFAGMIPFAAAYVELFFIMSSLWMDQYYYVFGFTLLVYGILLISATEVTLLLVYYQLCNENHRWWWFSLLSSGGIAYYLFIYSFVYFKGLEASRLLITYMLYFGYMFLISFAVFLITSSFGSLVSLWFVRKMFASIKVD